MLFVLSNRAVIIMYSKRELKGKNYAVSETVSDPGSGNKICRQGKLALYMKVEQTTGMTGCDLDYWAIYVVIDTN